MCHRTTGYAATAIYAQQLTGAAFRNYARGHYPTAASQLDHAARATETLARHASDDGEPERAGLWRLLAATRHRWAQECRDSIITRRAAA